MLPLALLPLLLLILGQRASSCTFDHLFVWLPSLCLDICLLCARLSTHFSAVDSVDWSIVCVGDIHLLFKLLLKFNVLIYTESRRSFTCNHNIKEDISTASRRFSFASKRNDAWTDPPRKHPRRKNWVQCLKITQEGLP